MTPSRTASILLNPGATGTILHPDRRFTSDQIVGSHVASIEIVKALLRYAPPGSVACIAAEEQTELARHELHRLEENDGGNFTSAPIVPYSAVDSFFEQSGGGLLFEMGGPWLHRAAWLRSRFARKPLPIQCLTHGFSYSEALLTLFVNLLITPTLPCDSVLCTTETARRAFLNRLEHVREDLHTTGITIERGMPRVDVVPLGVDTEFYRPSDRQEARRRLGLPQDKLLLLHFGRIDIAAKTDPSPLLFALKELAARHGERIGLVLAGSAPSLTSEHVQRIAAMLGLSGQVYLRQQPAPSEAPLYYAAADVFVSLSETLQESFGITPLEAMACGLPVVVSDWSGYRETVVHGETGLRVRTIWAECDEEVNLFAPLRSWEHDHLRLAQSVAIDEAEIVRCLSILLANPEARRKMGDAARRHVEAKYTWLVVVARLCALWSELSDIADSLPQDSAWKHHYMRSGYFADYSHYATVRLDASTPLAITQRGLLAVDQPQFLPLAEPMAGVLDVRILLLVLKLLQSPPTGVTQVTLSCAYNLIGEPLGQPRQRIVAHVMWLIKYGMLSVVSESLSPFPFSLTT